MIIMDKKGNSNSATSCNSQTVDPTKLQHVVHFVYFDFIHASFHSQVHKLRDYSQRRRRHWTPG